MKYFLVLIVLSVSSCSHQYMAVRAADQLKQVFSAEINEGILKEVIIDQDAQMTLLHIKQQHFSDLYTELTRKKIAKAATSEVNNLKENYLKVINRTNLVQKQIASFLEKVTTSRDIIYSEGMAFPDNYREKFLKSYIEDSSAAIDELMKEKVAFPYVLPSPPYFAGATFYLNEHKNRKVYGAEHGALLDLTLSTYKNDKLPQKLRIALIKECHKERENQILINLTKDIKELPYRQSSVRYLVCGSGHDFTDDIEAWNKTHPDMKLNLITFTPSALKKL